MQEAKGLDVSGSMDAGRSFTCCQRVHLEITCAVCNCSFHGPGGVFAVSKAGLQRAGAMRFGLGKCTALKFWASGDDESEEDA